MSTHKMNYYYQICNNVLCQIDDYHKSVAFIEKEGGIADLYTYYENLPSKSIHCKFIGTMKKNEIIYNGINISKSKNGDYLECLKKFSMYDLRRILYLIWSILTPQAVFGEYHGSYAGKIVAPYEAIKGAIKMIEFDMKILGNDELKNNIDMVNKYNKLEIEHTDLKEKYNKIKDLLS